MKRRILAALISISLIIPNISIPSYGMEAQNTSGDIILEEPDEMPLEEQGMDDQEKDPVIDTEVSEGFDSLPEENLSPVSLEEGGAEVKEEEELEPEPALLNPSRSSLSEEPSIEILADAGDQTTVSAEAPKITITKDPEGESYFLNDTVTLSVTASVNDGGKLSYQWFKTDKSDDVSGSRISSATGMTYKPSTSKESTVYYFCVVTNTVSSTSGSTSTSSTSDKVTVVVSKREGSLTVTMADWVYGSTASKPVLKSDTHKTTSNVTYLYTGETLAGNTYKSNIAPTEAGSYKIKVTCKETNEFKEISEEAEFEIIPKKIRISDFTIDEKKYDGEVSADLSLITFTEVDNDDNPDNDKIINLKSEDYSIDKLEFNDANAGDSKTVSLSITLNNSNYILATDNLTDGEFVKEDQKILKISSNATAEFWADPDWNDPDNADGESIDISTILNGEDGSSGVKVTLSGILAEDNFDEKYEDIAVNYTGNVFKDVVIGEGKLSFKVTDKVDETNNEVIPLVVTGLTNYETVTINITIHFYIDAKAPEITLQPQSSTYVLNDTVTPLTVEASSIDGGTLSYQWYSSADNTTENGTPIDGATAKEYTPLSDQAGTTYYYCIITNTNDQISGEHTAKTVSELVPVEIQKGQGSMTLEIQGWIYGEYDASVNEPVVDSTTHQGNTPIIVYTGVTKNGTKYAESTEVPEEAGSYQVKATYEATDNYEAVSLIRDFVIEQKAIQISDVTLEEKKYDGSTAATVSSVSFMSSADNAEVIDLEYGTDYSILRSDFNDPNVGTDKSVYTYIYLNNKNYSIAVNNFAKTGAEIVKGEATVVVGKFVGTRSNSLKTYEVSSLIPNLIGLTEADSFEALAPEYSGSIFNEVEINNGILSFKVAEGIDEEREEVIPLVVNDLTNYEKITINFTAYLTPDSIWVYGMKDQYSYTGNKITQNLLVYDGDQLLKEKTDYTITYKNNVNVYTYGPDDIGLFDGRKAPQAVITMKGNYKGSQIIYFKINPINLGLSGGNLIVDNLYVNYNSRKQTPLPTVTYKGKKLANNKDFYIKEYQEKQSDTSAFTDVGTYQLTIVGKGNYTGNAKINLVISNIKNIAMSKASVSGVKSLPWTIDAEYSSGITQSNITVKYGGKVLTSGTDFRITYENNRSVGEASLILQGTGYDPDKDGIAFVGTKRVNFKITGTNMSKVTVENLISSGYAYTGKRIEPTKLSKDSNNGKEIVVKYVLNSQTPAQILKEGTHYTVSYTNNINKGTATMILTGKESKGFTGQKKISFKINADPIILNEKNLFTVQLVDENLSGSGTTEDPYKIPYLKGGVMPTVKITTKDGRALVKDTDYTLSYRNNKAVINHLQVEPKKVPVVVIKGKGNFTGTVEIPFTIIKKDIDVYPSVYILANDKVENLKKNGWKQSYKVYDADGKTLANSDYLVKDVKYTWNGIDLLTVPDIPVPRGQEVTISITLTGPNYEPRSITGSYRILEPGYDISKATIQLAAQYYTGEELLITDQSQITKATIKIGKETRELVLNQDFEVVPGSYISNVKKGTAKVTLRGINAFGGTKTVTFKIAERNIADNWNGIFKFVN